MKTNQTREIDVSNMPIGDFARSAFGEGYIQNRGKIVYIEDMYEQRAGAKAKRKGYDY